MPKEQEMHDDWLDLVTNIDRTYKQIQSRVKELVGKYGAEEAVLFREFNLGSRQTPLMLASYKGRADVARALIDERANVNLLYNDITPTDIASREGHLNIVELLIDRKAEVKKLGVFSYHIAIASGNGHRHVVEYLHKANANINQLICMDKTPIHGAAEYNHLEVVKYLCENGAAINAQDLNKKSPIYIAANKFNINIVKYLVANKADINIKAENLAAPEFHNPFISILGTMVREVGKYSEHQNFDPQKIQFCKDIIKALLLSAEYPLHISSKSEGALVIDVLQESPFLIPYKEPAHKNSSGQFYSDPKISSQISANKSYIEIVFSSLYSAIEDNNLFSIIFGYLIEGNSQAVLQSLLAFIKNLSLEEASKQAIDHKAQTEEAANEDDADNANATAGISSSVLIEEIFTGKSSAEEAPEDLELSGSVFHHSED